MNPFTAQNNSSIKRKSGRACQLLCSLCHFVCSIDQMEFPRANCFAVRARPKGKRYLFSIGLTQTAKQLARGTPVWYSLERRHRTIAGKTVTSWSDIYLWISMISAAKQMSLTAKLLTCKTWKQDVSSLAYQ